MNTMNTDFIASEIKRRSVEYLSRDKAGKGFICPICGSGSGKNGTGITTRDGIHYTCWAGKCFKNSDIIDIIGLQHGLTDYHAKLNQAAKIFGIETKRGSANFFSLQAKLQAEKEQEEGESEPVSSDITSQFGPSDFFFLQANKKLEETNYHRGISMETLNRFQVGYVSEWRHPDVLTSTTSPRMIIPTSKSSYLARDTREKIPARQKPYEKVKVGGSKLFNSSILWTSSKPIFIVEGELDAMSVIDVGGEAVGLGSVSNICNFLQELGNSKPTQPLILSLDNDAAGKEATAKIVRNLKQTGIEFYVADISGPYKDPNECLNANREGFKEFVSRAVIMCQEKFEMKKLELEQESVFYSLDKFIKSIEKSSCKFFYPTGFEKLDQILDGGIYPGLYIVGAISSLGKTTFCLQIAEQIAQNETDVIVFSLEIPKNELIAKSISRLTYMLGDSYKAKTTREIMSKYVFFDLEEKDLINRSFEKYREYAKHLYIFEGIGNIGVEVIREKVEKHVKITGRTPVVVIDYLQILAPYNIRATDKQNIDKSVLELKRLSRDCNLPVIGISSFNRINYTVPVNMASFKESGAIEYASDCLIGLQYNGMDYKDGETDKERETRVRELICQYQNVDNAKSDMRPQEIQVKILKQRNGCKGNAVLGFYPMFNCFVDSGHKLETENFNFKKKKLFQEELKKGFVKVK